ncbi:MAG: hypothetical protein PVSMB7_28640 [Chloroflexota bacterium]
MPHMTYTTLTPGGSRMPVFSRLFLSCSLCVGAIGVTALVSPAARAQTATVSIVNFHFQPAVLTIAAGTSVTWTNQDSAAHAIAGNAGDFSSGTLNTGASYTFAFTRAGTYAYHCSIHPSMTGSIVVQGANATNTAAPTLSPPPPPGGTPTSVTPATSTPAPSATLVPTVAATPTATRTTLPPVLVKRLAARTLTLPHSGQTGTLRVEVTNKKSHAPLARARVRVDGGNVGVSRILIAHTNSRGLATFKHFHPSRRGTIKIQVSKTGFATTTTKVRVT